MQSKEHQIIFKLADIQEKEILELLNNPKTFNKGFELMIKSYQSRIYWVIRRMVISHDDANDLVQDVFVKVFRSFSSFKNQSSLYTWIYSIATNTTLNFLTGKKHKNLISGGNADQMMAERLRSDPWFDADEIMIKFQQAMSQLPEKQRIVFQMRYYDEIKYEDMSKMLDTSVGALKASYHHAVKKIEEYFAIH